MKRAAMSAGNAFQRGYYEHLTDAENEIVVKVRDLSTPLPFKGKQKISGEGYGTPRRADRQTVWLESVPEQYIKGLRITPLFDESEAELLVVSDSDLQCVAICDGREVLFTANEPVRLHIAPLIPWTPENPHLYDLEIIMGEDRVRSYFGMRKFSVGRDEKE